jgi:hypothetical protein
VWKLGDFGAPIVVRYVRDHTGSHHR